MADSEIRLRLSERAFCSTASESGKILKERDCRCIMSLTSVKPNLLIFPERPTASTPLFRSAGVQRSWGHILTFTAIFPHPAGLLCGCLLCGWREPSCGRRDRVLHVRSHHCNHPWGQDALMSQGQQLFEFPAHHYWSFRCRTRNQTKIHGHISLYTVFRCSVSYKYWGRIEIRFSTNQHELSSESICNSELRKGFLVPEETRNVWLWRNYCFYFKHTTEHNT